MMSDTTAPTTTVDITDLHRRPGGFRRVRRRVDAQLMPSVPLVTPAGDIGVDLLLESLVDGVLARGHLSTDIDVSCARCLTAARSEVATDVAELFADPARTRDDEELEDGYVIEEVDGHPTVDLETLIRDAMSASVPFRPLCRPDCAGLCAGCGADLNTEVCVCRDDMVDDRWAALRTLDLPEGPA